MKATQQDGSYPRPMLCREQWAGLDGSWDFAHDDADEGRAARWFDPSASGPFTRQIIVPFPPESPASQIGDRGFHPVVWYRRRVPADVLDRTAGERVLIHFGAVDFRAQVWFDGQLVGSHVGGQTPFSVDVTDLTGDAEAGGEHVLVVRAEDDPSDLEQPRGKQDWREQPHGIWYHRTTGIWQPVWVETVPADHVVDLAWTFTPASASIGGEFTLNRAPAGRLELALTVRLGDEILAEQTVVPQSRTSTVEIGVEALRNGQDRARLIWSPEHPTLLDLEVVLRERVSGTPIDTVASYLGLRSVSVGGRSFQLNGQPYYLRAVLNQGYRPQTHLASTGSDQLRAEVELLKQMGFNTVRNHQKAEDPRFLYWADRLGLLVWAETAAGYAYSATAVELLTREWTELVRRDRSHPSVVVWVPINESWGVQDIATSPAQQSFARSIADLTRALDPTRPVMSNEGWEHVDSDILGLHDYTTVPENLRARYGTRQAADDLVRSAHGPQGRRPILTEQQLSSYLAGDAPLMLTEFGGISLSSADGAWGYASAGTATEYATLVGGLFDAVRAGQDVVGYCYTQFMDTGQETNGMLFEDGRPKLPLELIRQIVTGIKDGVSPESGSTDGWQD